MQLDGWAVCVAHRGAHGVWQGYCVAVGKEVRRPYLLRSTRCQTCGDAVDVKRVSRQFRAETLTAGTDRRHWHEPAVAVTLDADDLAEAIVRASRAARAERQQTPQTNVQTPPQTVFAAADQQVKGSINGVDVVRPEPD